MCASVAAVALGLSAAAASPPELMTAVQLARIRADLARVPRDATEAELARALSGDGLTCTERAAVGYLRPWERTCVRREPGYEAGWTFRALLLAEPLAPRLEALRVRASGLDQDAVWTLHRLLVEELDRTLPRDDGADWPGVAPIGARGVRRWKSAKVDVQLFWLVLRSGERAIELRAEHHRPDELREAKLRIETVGLAALQKERLARSLAAELPELEKLLLERSPSWSFDELRPTLHALVTKAKRARPVRRAALLLAADFIAARARTGGGEWVGDLEVHRVAGRRFVHQHGHWDPWFHHDLLPEIAVAPEGGFWSDVAYVRLLELGWDPAGGCGAGRPRALHGVIAAAEAFLAERPASPMRANVRLLLAQAYEAWWWVSGLQEPDPNAQSVTPAERRGGERARRRAIAAYRALLGETSDAVLRTYATAHLAQLLLRVDTFQSRFSCTSYC